MSAAAKPGVACRIFWSADIPADVQADCQDDSGVRLTRENL